MNESFSLSASNDQILSPQAAAHSRAQLARNWVKVQSSLMAFIVSSVPQFSDAEDLLQEVAAELALRFDEYDSSRPFLPWALWVAKIKIADYFRERQRGRAVFLFESVDELAGACTRAQEDWAEERTVLEKCLGQLTDRSRAIIQMRYSEELNPRDIGPRIGVTPESVRVTLSRIRSALLDCVKVNLNKRSITAMNHPQITNG